LKFYLILIMEMISATLFPLFLKMIEPFILHYCNYQERCHQEVRNKLYDAGITGPEVERQIALLIENGILNEERFAKAFAGGKFRIKKWGRVKIKQQLKLRKVADYCIRKGLAEIGDEDYAATLRLIAERKAEALKREKNKLVGEGKLYRFLVQKGYEHDLVADLVKDLL